MYVFIFDLKYFKSSVDQITENRHLILLYAVLLCYTQFLLQTSYLQLDICGSVHHAFVVK